MLQQTFNLSTFLCHSGPYFVFWSAGVAHEELTAVVTVEVHVVVAAGRRDKEAPGVGAEIIMVFDVGVAEGVDPFGPVSGGVFVEVPDVGQISWPCVIPALNL